jgi:hypothetical protein
MERQQMIRTPEGKRLKENPEISEKIERTITSLKIAAKRAEVLSTLGGHAGWETVKDILGEKVKSIDGQLKKFLELEPRKVDSLHQQKLDFEFILTIVEDFVESVPGFHAAIERNQKELDARKQSAGA